MDFFAPLISPVVECIGGSCATVVRQIGYIKNLERNFKKLNEEAGNLFDKKKDTEHEIKRHGNNKEPTHQCRGWLQKVDEIQKEVSSIDKEHSKGDKRCLSQWCLHVPSSWKLGRRIVLKTDAISDLCDKAKFDGGVVVDALPPTAETKPVLTIQDGTSAERTLQKILNSVRDPIKHKIGIWGMGGVGKTTVMTHLNNLPEIAEMFEIVIWVTVSQDYSTRNLQIEILDRLGLKELSEGVNVERVASRLLQELTNRKFLLLMDDLWKEVGLHDIGVPCPNQKGCKIVFTTRYLDICRKMEINEEIKVEPFSEKEAWSLFREKVGEVADSPIIGPLATSVVHECGGLPLAIAVIGASLRMEDNVHVWQNAVQELSSPDTSDICDMEEVFRRLKFSFDRLENDDVKGCFLYVALYPEDFEIKISELIEYWRAEGLIHSRSTLASVRNKGHAMVKRLIDASLLLKSDESNDCVKMHDVIRDLALRITSRTESGCRFLVRAKKMIEEPPKNEEWENVNRMSLMENEIVSLPERPNCPTILTLLLQWNRKLTTIPESFFDQMHALRVLDLSETGIKSLPHSICHLVNLRGLYLKYCQSLKTLPPEIGKLTRIEVLDAEGTSINSLPTEIRQLSGLKVLHVTFSMERDENEEDEKVSGGIISRLSQLEQLIIDLGFRYGNFSRYGDTCVEVVMEEVCSMKGLTSLNFGFPKMEYFECFLQRSHPWKKGMITSFHFIVGHYKCRGQFHSWLFYSPESEGMARMLTFCGYDSIPNAIVEVLRHADSFQLLSHKSFHSLCEFGMQNMSGLINCTMHECDAMGVVVDGHQLAEAALPNLELLTVSHMPNLRSIWEGSFPPGSLNWLADLHLFMCGKLKNIFSREIIQQLSNLEVLQVERCSALEELISDGEIGVESDCVLPKLNWLVLQNLPSLVRILKLGSRHLLNCSSLEWIRTPMCPNLKRLPISVSKAPKLRRIQCEREWWNELEWDDNDVKLQLEPLVIPF
eukprot:TRINITY_DN2364_c0_g1_i8.p1 TRINITY_DN2364_c0_g1~~TRINITY_DN2364_c0_g1_i8.p1  ORF type:complete len:996 (-),score=146.65 TRINITY_DN2364_c0_g1_i8:514-3501(-)